MRNLFHKLMVLEFGEREYRRLLHQVLNDKEENFVNMAVTWQLAEHLNRKKNQELRLMSLRLENCLLCSYRINRGLLPFLLFSLCCIGLLLLGTAGTGVWPVALLGMLICDGYRVKEYVVNKYCYADAKLILCYRIALEDCIREG